MVGSGEMSFEKWFLFRDTLVFWGLYEMPFLFNQFMASYDTTFSRKQQANPPPELEVSIWGVECSQKKCLQIWVWIAYKIATFCTQIFSYTPYDPYAISFTNWKH